MNARDSGLAIAATLVALAAAPSGLRAESYGLGPQVLYVTPQDFQPNSADSGRLVYGGNYFYVSSPAGTSYDAPLRLPAGAQIDSLRCFFFSDGDATTPSAVIVTRDFDTVSKIGSGSGILATAAAPQAIGYHEPSGLAVVAPETLVRYRPSDTVSRFYIVQLALLDTGDLTRGCEVVWHRTLSEAPGSPTFVDVQPGDPLYDFVEALAAAGITSGCDASNYCPDAPLTRGQAAVFFARALGLHWAD